MLLFTKKRIGLFRRNLSILTMVWFLLLTQTELIAQLFFLDSSQTVYRCLNWNPFDSSCNWNNYGFGLSLLLFIFVIPIAMHAFVDRTKLKSSSQRTFSSDINNIVTAWKNTNKFRLMVLIILGVVFSYYIIVSANNWINISSGSL